MSDPLSKITEGKDLIGKVRNSCRFHGYLDRRTGGKADVSRQTIAQRYEEHGIASRSSSAS
jgi:hypothetical protein